MKKKLAAGASVLIPGLCSFIKIETAEGTVSIEAEIKIPLTEGGHQVVTIQPELKAGQGYNIGLPINGFTLKNNHTAEQVIEFETAFGEIVDNSVAGTVNIGNEPKLTPQDIGDLGFYRTGASSLLDTIVAPAANVNGIVLTSYALRAYNEHIRLMVKGSAPTGYNDPAARTIALWETTSTSITYESKVKLPLFILPGDGLYAQCSGGINTSHVSTTHKVN